MSRPFSDREFVLTMTTPLSIPKIGSHTRVRVVPVRRSTLPTLPSKPEVLLGVIRRRGISTVAVEWQRTSA